MVNNTKQNRYIAATLSCIMLFSVVFIVLAVSDNIANAKSKVRFLEGDEWRYSKGMKMPPRKWNHLGFNDANWQRGRSPFGFGADRLGTSLPDMRRDHSTLLVRREFTVNPLETEKIYLSVVCDGSFIAYINGIEVARSKTRLAEPINLSGFIDELLSGKNVLAIECSFDDTSGSSFRFLPLLEILEKN